MSTALTPRIVRCPSCGGDSLYASTNPSRPFCSERCKGVDFGAWATESYRVEARPGPDDELLTEQAASTPPSPHH